MLCFAFAFGFNSVVIIVVCIWCLCLLYSMFVYLDYAYVCCIYGVVCFVVLFVVCGPGCDLVAVSLLALDCLVVGAYLFGL